MAIPLHVACLVLAACPAAACVAPGTSTVHIRKVQRGRHVRAARGWGELTLGSLPSCQVLASFPKSAHLWGEGGGGVSAAPGIIRPRDSISGLPAASGQWPLAATCAENHPTPPFMPLDASTASSEWFVLVGHVEDKAAGGLGGCRKSILVLQGRLSS
jgi:hypothetical protein